MKSWLTGKDPDVGRDWGQEKGTTEDEIAGWQSPTRWTWVWVNSRSWWWAGRPGMLRFMGSQRADTTERLNWTEMNNKCIFRGWLNQLLTNFKNSMEKRTSIFWRGREEARIRHLWNLFLFFWGKNRMNYFPCCSHGNENYFLMLFLAITTWSC